MDKLIEMILSEKLIPKDAISALLKCRPPKKISLANMISENLVDVSAVENFLAKKIKQGSLTLTQLDEIEGLNTTQIGRAHV